MPTPSRLVLGVLALAGALTACSDVTAPAAARSPAVASFSGGSSTGSGTLSDGSLLGGGGGGGSVALSCGTLSANVQTYNIVVYTTRIGIGFSGTATNCGTRNEALEVDVVDQNSDPVCAVNVPHFIAARNSAPAESITWSANSTLVNCMNTTHTFDLRLWDTKTGQTLATTTVSAFL